jgi:acyl-CoA thioesterase-1
MLLTWRPRLLVAAICLLASACGQCGSRVAVLKNRDASATPAAGPATSDARPKVVVLGDSLTAGLGLVETQSFPGILQQKVDALGFDFEVVNAGVSGDTSAGGLRRLDWALQEDVRVLIVALGANDGLRGLSVGEMKQNLGQIIEQGREKGAVVILAGMEAPPNYGQEYATAFRQAYRDLARQYKVQFIPFLLDKVAGQPALNQADGIHPNVQGAAIVADTVWAVLEPILNQIANS